MSGTRAIQLLVGLAGLVIAVVAVIPVIAVAAPFWLIGALTRAAVSLFQPSVVRWPELFAFHQTLGWKAKANFGAYCLEERDDVFYVSTGPDGWPGRRTIEESRVVVFGDSHAFGYGVDTKRAFFELADIPIKTMGAPGYNMVQEVLLMEEVAASLNGKVVVLFAYYGNDLYDNLSPEMGGYRVPFVTQANGNWTIVTRHINASKWVASSGRQGRQRHRIPQKLFRRTFLADRAFSACEFLIRKGRDICHEAGAEFMVMTIPTPEMLESAPAVHGDPINAEYPDQMLGKICDQLDVRLIRLKEHLSRQDYKRSDEHWTERGHRKVAMTIARICRQPTGR